MATIGSMAGPGVIWAILRRPRLWGEALRAGAALAPRAWWTRRPWLPIPDATYTAWRTATAYGSSDPKLRPSDVVAYLQWRRRFRREIAGSGVASG